MSYQEKRTIVTMITGALILAAYCVYAVNQYQSGALAPGDLKSWAQTILIFIGIGVVASIIIQIVFHVLLSITVAVTKKIQDETVGDRQIEKSIQAEMVVDEMGELIELKSTRIGLFLAGIGFVLALLSLVFNYPPAVMLNILFISFAGGALVEGIAQLYYYRRGVQHG